MDKQPIRVLYIEDRNGVRARVIEHQPNQTTLEMLQSLVGGLIERVELPEFPGADMWVNEEGLMIPGLQRNTYATLFARSENYHPYPIVGPAVIAGYGPEGETLSVTQEILDYFADITIKDTTYSTVQIKFLRMLVPA